MGDKLPPMPLVRIDLRRGKPATYVLALGDAVHRAIVDVFGTSVRDHFQVITEHDPDRLITDPNYLNIDRSDDVVLIEVVLSAGRSIEQKQAFYARVAALAETNPGIRPEDLFITLVENQRQDWSFGNGEAQYVIRPREEWK
jgi:phenylpyruvate tautomerase PptA (4-oxalocrotonate tautomerase family)